MSSTRDMQVSLTKQDTKDDNAVVLAQRKQDINALKVKAENVAALANDVHTIIAEKDIAAAKLRNEAKKAAQTSEHAVDALAEAETHQRDRRRRLLIFLGVLLFIGVALGCGFPIGGLFGFTGIIAAVVGAAIIIGACALIGACVYGLFRLIRGKLAGHTTPAAAVKKAELAVQVAREFDSFSETLGLTERPATGPAAWFDRKISETKPDAPAPKAQETPENNPAPRP